MTIRDAYLEGLAAIPGMRIRGTPDFVNTTNQCARPISAMLRSACVRAVRASRKPNARLEASCA